MSTARNAGPPLALPKVAFVQALAASALEESRLDPYRCPFMQELLEVRRELERRGVEVRPIFAGDELPALPGLSPDEVFAFGDRDAMGRWIDALGLQPDVAGSYPSALGDLLHRRTWQGTPSELVDGPANALRPVFVKPSRPLFHGRRKVESRICEGVEALLDLPPELRDASFICSEVVEWMSEYRCYILHSRPLAIHHYFMRIPEGWEPAEFERLLPQIRPTERMVQEVVDRLDAARQSVAGYCLDFGLIAYGPMALVEMNDGLALTNYGLAPADYLDLHLARWQELVAGAVPA